MNSYFLLIISFTIVYGYEYKKPVHHRYSDVDTNVLLHEVESIPWKNPYHITIEKKLKKKPTHISKKPSYFVIPPRSYPVIVERPIPIVINSPIPYNVKVPIKAPIYKKVKVPVPKPYYRTVAKPYIVNVPRPYVVQGSIHNNHVSNPHAVSYQKHLTNKGVYTLVTKHGVDAHHG